MTVSPLSDRTLFLIARSISGRWNRRTYEDLLLELGLYGIDELRGEEGYSRLNKDDFIIETLRDQGRNVLSLLATLDERHALNAEATRALALDGVEFGVSLAGDIAVPAREESTLESGLRRQGLQAAMNFFDQSAQNYVQGAYEAANAMTRSALEHQVQEIAQRISAMRANEPIPQRNRNFIGPVDYRNYLETTRFLEASEKSFLDHFYHYASTNGSHPGVSSEAEARLRRFVAVAIALLFVEKLDNQAFMQSLV